MFSLHLRTNILTLFGLLFLTACTSMLSIQSEPQQVEVFANIEGKAEKTKLGQTPLDLSETQLADTLNLNPENSYWIEYTFKKENFETKTVFLPSSRFGELNRTFKIKLNPMEESSSVVTKMMRMMFNAKKYAESKQFEQAHSELDKVLAMDSKIPQVFSMKAGIYFLQGNMSEAQAYYTKAIGIDPSFSEAIQMLDRIKNKAGAN